jgi:hypothetical protein
MRHCLTLECRGEYDDEGPASGTEFYANMSCVTSYYGRFGNRVAGGCAVVAAAWLLAAGAEGRGADRIVLRNLKIISDRQVVSLDVDGVRLDQGPPVTWDEIERGTIAGDKQADFDRLLKELGTPLFQIRQRLTVGDYQGLVGPAESVYPRYAERRSETAYMVMQALMWARLAEGRREAAVEPYLRCYEYLKATRAGGNLPGERRLAFDPATAVSSELPPVWFDADSAKAALPGVYQAVLAMQQPRPAGTLVYYGTLALAAGETNVALRMLQGVPDQPRLTAELRDIALAGATVRLETSLDKLLPQNRPLALYWLGLAKTADKDEEVRRAGVLQLLYLPALHGKQFPDLAGAGLYHAMQTLAELGDAKGSVEVRKELLVRYPQTVHAARVKAESGLNKP